MSFVVLYKSEVTTLNIESQTDLGHLLQAWLFTAVSSTHRSLISVLTFYCRRPEAVAECVVDLIKDESTEAGQVVKVTYEDGVEYLNFNDVRIMSPDISLYWLSKIKE